MTDTTFVDQVTVTEAAWFNDANQAVYRGVALWGVAGGTSDAITVTLSPVPIALYPGMLIRVRASAANATTTPTLNANGLGALAIQRLGGTALSVGDIAADQEMLLVYSTSGTNHWEFLNAATYTQAQLYTRAQSIAEFAALSGNSTQPFLVGPATVPAAAVQLEQISGLVTTTVIQVLTPTASTTITPTALKTVVLPSSSSAMTLTLDPGTVEGQLVVVYGDNGAVTVDSSVSSGNPALLLPDGTSVYSYVLVSPSNGYGIELVWDTVNWRVKTFGPTVVAPAFASNQAVNLGQLGSGTGYQKFPSGKIDQTIRVAATIGTAAAYTFPITFPTTVDSIQMTYEYAGTTNYIVLPTSLTLSGVSSLWEAIYSTQGSGNACTINITAKGH